MSVSWVDGAAAWLAGDRQGNDVVLQSTTRNVWRAEFFFFFFSSVTRNSVRVHVEGKESEGWRFQGLFFQLSRVSRLMQDSSTKVSQGFIIATVTITIPAASDTTIVTQTLGMKFSTLESREAYRSFILYSFAVTIWWNCYFCKVSAGKEAKKLSISSVREK